MSFILAIALLLFLFTVSIAVIFSIVILFHLQKYAVPGDHTASAKRAFLIGNGLFFLLAIIAIVMLFI